MSTARYSNAGPPGTGTTIDNMASRVKSWAYINQTGTQALLGSFNVTSVVDVAVGATGTNMTATLANTNLSVQGCGMLVGSTFGGAACMTYNTSAYQMGGFVAWGGASADLNSLHAALFGNLA